MMTENIDSLRERARFLKQLRLDETATACLERAQDGFLLRKDYEASLRASDKETDPVVLPLRDEDACQYQIGDEVALLNASGEPLAIWVVEDKWLPNRKQEAELRFGSADESNPRVKALLEDERVYFGGKVTRLR